MLLFKNERIYEYDNFSQIAARGVRSCKARSACSATEAS